MEGKLRSATKDLSFISKSFVNWKDATEALKGHEMSKCHQDDCFTGKLSLIDYSVSLFTYLATYQFYTL